MKVKEFIEELSKYPDHFDDTITIEKHDKNQLCCSATVPIKKWQFGFDWEHGQVVLKPEIDLCTTYEETERKLMHNICEYLQKRLTSQSISLSRIARWVNDEVKDEELKTNLLDMIGEIVNSCEET